MESKTHAITVLDMAANINKTWEDIDMKFIQRINSKSFLDDSG